MDKLIRDYVKTQRLNDQINNLVQTSYALFFSVIFLTVLFLDILSSVEVGAYTGFIMIVSIGLLGSCLELRDKTIVV
tara:strand:- start:6349 stop:6579 length:231 start_codon:yes stop_codon:yes gene_type:complete